MSNVIVAAGQASKIAARKLPNPLSAFMVTTGEAEQGVISARFSERTPALAAEPAALDETPRLSVWRFRTDPATIKIVSRLKANAVRRLIQREFTDNDFDIGLFRFARKMPGRAEALRRTDAPRLRKEFTMAS